MNETSRDNIIDLMNENTKLHAEIAAAVEWARSFKKLMAELPILDCPESHQALKEQKK